MTLGLELMKSSSFVQMCLTFSVNARPWSSFMLNDMQGKLSGTSVARVTLMSWELISRGRQL